MYPVAQPQSCRTYFQENDEGNSQTFDFKWVTKEVLTDINESLNIVAMKTETHVAMEKADNIVDHMVLYNIDNLYDDIGMKQSVDSVEIKSDWDTNSSGRCRYSENQGKVLSSIKDKREYKQSLECNIGRERRQWREESRKLMYYCSRSRSRCSNRSEKRYRERSQATKKEKIHKKRGKDSRNDMRRRH